MSNAFKNDMIALLKKHDVDAFAISVMTEENGKQSVKTMIGGTSESKAVFLAVEMAKDAIDSLSDKDCDCEKCSPKEEEKPEVNKDAIKEFVESLLKDLMSK